MSAPGIRRLAFEFFGVRGSYPVAGSRAARVGGNTPSVLVELPDGSQLILDAGTGIVAIGQRSPPRHVRLFLSHLHWDHIQGLPFYRPLYDSETRLTVYARRPADQVRDILRAQMASPTFPIELAAAGAGLEIVQLDGPWELGGATLTPIALNHPGNCSGLRVDAAGRSLVFATDHEAGDAAIDDALIAAARGCDALILDAQYDARERRERVGWGHSSWNEAVEIARRCEAERLYLFHHDPDRDDAAMASLEASALAEFEGATLAIEGARVIL